MDKIYNLLIEKYLLKKWIFETFFSKLTKTTNELLYTQLK